MGAKVSSKLQARQHENGTVDTAMRVELMPRVSIRALMDRFGFSKATAWRYVHTWHAVRGLPYGR
jgi:hypothetical protein